jgi:hypothetical protein
MVGVGRLTHHTPTVCTPCHCPIIALMPTSASIGRVLRARSASVTSFCKWQTRGFRPRCWWKPARKMAPLCPLTRARGHARPVRQPNSRPVNYRGNRRLWSVARINYSELPRCGWLRSSSLPRLEMFLSDQPSWTSGCLQGWLEMYPKDCRRKAHEFLVSADLADDLDERIGWLLLANVWFSLADRIEDQEQPATSAS